ncbi:MAG: S8 family serine peptidase, partial [Oscillospiraceae bacterium]|nr:S8 family serine peptidase [Oscillospiraceae bacterium]
MNKRFLKAFAVFIIIAITLFIGAITVIADSNDDFYDACAQLIGGNWDENYFGIIKLKIGSPVMVIDGVEKDIDPGRDTAATTINDRTMLPIRAIVEETGGSVEWDEAAGKVTISDRENVVEMTIGATRLFVNGIAVDTDVAPVVINDRTMLPIRVVAESLGFEVGWLPDTDEAALTKNFQMNRLIVKTIGDSADSANGADNMNSADNTNNDESVNSANSINGANSTSGAANASSVDFNQYGAGTVLAGPDGIYVLQFDTMAKTKAAFEAISNERGIEYVEPDRIVRAPSSSGAPFGDVPHNSWGVESSHFPGYINYINGMNRRRVNIEPRILVAVCDTGVDSSHSFLASHMVAGRNFIDEGAANYTNDGYNHGTHVAGIIIDCLNGLEPFTVSILPIKVFSDAGNASDLSISNGIRFAADSGARVINLSLGMIGHSEIEHDAVNYAMLKGSIPVVSAGNNGMDTVDVCPADIVAPIVVAAVDCSNQPADVSWYVLEEDKWDGWKTNYGASIDLAAPGVDILGCIPGGGFASKGGTSMAAPHVSAAAALLLLEKPSRTPAQVEMLIKGFVSAPYSWNSVKYGNGILDMGRAPSIIISNITSEVHVAVGSSTGHLKVEATVTPSGAEPTYQWCRTIPNGGIPVDGATSATFNVPAAFTQGQYTYHCLLSAPGAETIKSPPCTVIVNKEIVITAQPAPVTGMVAGSVSGGLNITANVIPSGTPSYQWYSNNMASTANGSIIAGATSAAYSFAATLPPGTFYYYCVVSAAGAGSVTSDLAAVYVVESPRILVITYPVSQAVQAGSSCTFSAKAIAIPSGTVKYQWYKEGSPVHRLIDDATSDTFSLSDVAISDGGNYFCIFSAAGFDSVYSTLANLTVFINPPPITIYAEIIRLDITIQPIDYIRRAVGDISGGCSFNVDVITIDGTIVIPTYQWYSNTRPSASGGAPISGAISETFEFPPDLKPGSYYYYCVATVEGEDSVTSDVAVLTVLDEQPEGRRGTQPDKQSDGQRDTQPDKQPDDKSDVQQDEQPGKQPVITISTQPAASMAVTEGKISDYIEIDASSSNGARISYQWYRTYPDSSRSSRDIAVKGATSSKFDIPADLAVGTYYYYCALSAAGCETVNSDKAAVTVASRADLRFDSTPR